MLVFVTGANGFVGRHLCQHLCATGHRVRALVRPGADLVGLENLELELVGGDVTAPESLRTRLDDVDAVVHLAGVVTARLETTYHRVNALGSQAVAVVAAEQGVARFVLVSSLAAQGPSPAGRPHIDSGNEAPINAYGRSKLEAERLVAESLPDGTLTILRPCVVYGPWDREMLMWGALARLRVIPVVSGLELSFVHVDDLVAAIMGALTTEKASLGPFFISDGVAHQMADVVDLVEQSLQMGPLLRLGLPLGILTALQGGSRLLARTAVGSYMVRTLGELTASGWVCQPDHARETLGFVPTRDFRSALPELFGWYRDNGWL